ncbi:DUF1257 domain-containing protein [Actinophytocola sp.]|uniref:DUF1257 domain-containing protein n=1 Tax=Actinophytocola sp. TaxID=1872138 RepID=UPI002ECFF13B
MSHFTRVLTQLRNVDVLVEALRAVGHQHVEVHDQPQTLYGYEGDVRPEKAEVIIRRRHVGQSSNDIGFARRPDGAFEAIISAFDRSRYDTTWLARLTHSYGYVATLRYAETHGYEVATDELQPDGSRRLTLRRTT